MPVFLVAGCKTAPERQKLDFSKVTEDFVYGSLALTPVSATQAGYPRKHQGVKLDEKLDDFSPSGIEAEQEVLYRIQGPALWAWTRLPCRRKNEPII